MANNILIKTTTEEHERIRRHVRRNTDESLQAWTLRVILDAARAEEARDATQRESKR